MPENTFQARSESRTDGTSVVSIVGALDLYTAPQLERALALNGGAKSRVVVDLSDCTFIDSSGLGILLAAHRRVGSTGLLIVAVGQPVLRAFEVSGLDRHFVLHPTLESALNGAS